MKITYLARHGQEQSNDDEGAIAHALRELGCEVQCFHERDWAQAVEQPADVFLFNKWWNIGALNRLEGRARRVFWQFDWLTGGCDQRLRRNVLGILPHVDLGFCTDGDFVAEQQNHKLHWLMQGADGRVASWHPFESEDRCPILFCGGGSIGPGRKTWISEMRNRWQSRFVQITGFHGEPLARRVAGAEVVVAPDAPFGELYWSNRLFLMMGFGAFLLHPWSQGVERFYADRREVVFYRSRAELHELIEHYLDRPQERQQIAENGLERTLEEHLYLHRCEQLLATIRHAG